GEETFERHAPRHILDMRIEAVVFVDDYHPRHLFDLLHPGEIARYGTPAGLEPDHIDCEARIVFRYDRRQRVIVLKLREQYRRYGSAAREARQPFKKIPARHRSMRITVETIDILLLHGRS